MIKLTDAELKVMNVIWHDGDCSAKHIADVLAETVGWHVNTTYTIIHKCIEKGAIEREDPKFICHARISKEEAQADMTEDLVNKLYDGSKNSLFAALLGKDTLSDEQIAKLRRIVAEME
ncbi:MAG: BlaI/MecI/CopY family transcriptional regulator [Oscillospiraceae bacterium]|nr:BlaI/MecI/CopY family transcriptional regulator [Oscillospiraceae bacterium]